VLTAGWDGMRLRELRCRSFCLGPGQNKVEVSDALSVTGFLQDKIQTCERVSVVQQVD